MTRHAKLFVRPPGPAPRASVQRNARQILDVIRVHQRSYRHGATWSEIRDATGLSGDAVAHRLRALVAAGALELCYRTPARGPRIRRERGLIDARAREARTP